jgi:B12 binding domain/Radical SAM superfamily
MELYHNQVTRVQGPFSLRMFHRSWGLLLLQANVSAPCVLLDFPSLDRFVEESRERSYDIVGIGSITTNLLKVRRMCELVRQYQPEAAIVVGGHIANLRDLSARIDADWIVRDEGVHWLRKYLGEDPHQPIRHPVIPTRIGTRNLDIPVEDHPRDVAATTLPSVGCPIGCNFCATSSMFGGKGKYVNYCHTGDELFDIMSQMEELRGTRSFLVMDEYFLLYRRRALRLLEFMQKHDKSWSLYVFSSAAAIRSYSMEELIALGVSWIWMGLESEDGQYQKLHGIDTIQLVRQLQSRGIRILGSTIIGLDSHTPENIDAAIDYAFPARYGLPPVHALHAAARHSPARGNGRQGAAARCGWTGRAISVAAGLRRSWQSSICGNRFDFQAEGSGLPVRDQEPEGRDAAGIERRRSGNGLATVDRSQITERQTHFLMRACVRRESRFPVHRVKAGISLQPELVAAAVPPERQFNARVVAEIPKSGMGTHGSKAAAMIQRNHAREDRAAVFHPHRTARHAPHDDIIDREPWASIGTREVVQDFNFPSRFHQKDSSMISPDKSATVSGTIPASIHGGSDFLRARFQQLLQGIPQAEPLRFFEHAIRAP